jgi:2-methylisocitrate lyase-like PEP mutase family enzyme
MMTVRKRFRQLMDAPGCVAMPGAYDALSARLIENAGFESMIAGGYAAVGSMLAQADMGQSNMRDYCDHYARICGAVDIPVYADADTGFGGTSNVRQMIRAFESAGVAGLFITDQTFPNRCGYLPGKQVVPAEQMVAKIKAALDARTDPDFYICARTDAVLVEGLDRAIERCQIYMQAGADMAKPQAVDTIDDIKRVIREVPSRHMATLSQAKGGRHMTVTELDAAGVTAATFPSIALFAAAKGVREALGVLKRDESLENVGEHLIALDDYYAVVGLKAQMQREERYDSEAAALVRKQAAE